MKIKTQFTLYNIIMLITPIFLIGVISVCFLIIFIMKYPVEELNIGRASLLSPIIFAQAFGDFFKNHPDAMMYIFLWLFLCILVLIISTTTVTRLMTKSVEKPIKDLAAAAADITNGNLDFEVMGSSYDEIDTLCGNFDTMCKELKLAQKREQLMKSERSMLLANISHDLKTPVTSIKGYIEGIRDGIADTPQKRERYLDTIYDKANVIDDLVSNLSAFSKLELSRLSFAFDKMDINEFLHDFFESCRLDFEKNHVKLINNIPSETAIINADRKKMQRVFSNLADNAVKYGSSDSPRMEVASVKRDGRIYITVSDNGIGIEETELANVFDGFYRVDTSRAVAGSGLGLGIVKQIIEKHGGKIWLKSDGLGKGTTAIICLPLIS